MIDSRTSSSVHHLDAPVVKIASRKALATVIRHKGTPREAPIYVVIHRAIIHTLPVGWPGYEGVRVSWRITGSTSPDVAEPAIPLPSDERHFGIAPPARETNLARPTTPALYTSASRWEQHPRLPDCLSRMTVSILPRSMGRRMVELTLLRGVGWRNYDDKTGCRRRVWLPTVK